MNNDIGLLIKNLRKKKNISQENLATKTYISRSSLSMIEIGKREAPEDFLILASSVLDFDFISFTQKSSKFKNIEHFNLAYSLLGQISSNNFNKKDFIENPIIQEEFDYGEALYIKKYCITISLMGEKEYSKALDICLDFLNIERANIKNFKPKINMPSYYYGQIISFGSCLYQSGDKENSHQLLINMVDFLESTYFNKDMPFSSVEFFYYKLYILCLNNLANSYFDFKEYEKALEICNNGIYQSRRLDVLSLLDALLELKTEILYYLSDINGAKASFTHFKAICEITGYDDYFQGIMENFKTLYPSIFE